MKRKLGVPLENGTADIILGPKKANRSAKYATFNGVKHMVIRDKQLQVTEAYDVNATDATDARNRGCPRTHERTTYAFAQVRVTVPSSRHLRYNQQSCDSKIFVIVLSLFMSNVLQHSLLLHELLLSVMSF